MDCILIGSGGMAPMPYRMLTSMAVRLGGDVYLFDCGEGTQIGWKKLRIGVRGLKVLAVTHLHADHCLGIPGIMMLKAQMENPQPLTIIGPPGIEEFISRNRSIMDFNINYPLSIIEWSAGKGNPAFEDKNVRINWLPLLHTRFCLGYRLEEVERPGKFHANRAVDFGVPEGPLWGKLQRGEEVLNLKGERIRPEQVVGPPREGRRIAFAVDTRPTENVHELCTSADIAFLEGMFLPEDERHAEEKGHMTIKEAAEIAAHANVKRAVLVHISPRYRPEDMEKLEAVAKACFPTAEMGADLNVYSAPYPDDDDAPADVIWSLDRSGGQ